VGNGSISLNITCYLKRYSPMVHCPEEHYHHANE